jgi:integrase
MLRQDDGKHYSAEFKHRTFGRIHLRLKTTVKSTAMNRHSALEQLLDTGEPVRDLVEALRARKLTIESVYECVRSKRPFESLRASTWPTLAAGKARLIEHLEAGQGSNKTTLSTGHALSHAVAYFGGERRLENITPDEVAAFRAHMIGLGLHSNTVALYLTKFGALFTFLQERERKAAQHAKRVPAVLFSPLDRDEHVPIHQPTRLRFLYEAEAELVLAASPARVQLAVALGLFAGLRMGEILMLRRSVDVDVETGILFIQARDGWQPKHGRNRQVPICSTLLPYVERHLAEFAGEKFLFPGQESGLPRSERNLQYLFTRIITDAGLKPGRTDPDGVTFHTLRHTFASWSVMAGADLLTIARLMGHSSIKQVQEVYGHLSPQHMRDAVEKLSARWTLAQGTAAGTSTSSTPSDATETPQETQ